MRAFWDRVAGAVGEVASIVVGGAFAILMLGWFALDLASCVSFSTESRLDDCEQAFDDYMTNDATTTPSILSEDWCFDHLTGQDG
ncbi:MAG: hypothetical protein ACRDZV_12165 [Acidimicrobiia bacterium]